MLIWTVTDFFSFREFTKLKIDTFLERAVAVSTIVGNILQSWASPGLNFHPSSNANEEGFLMHCNINKNGSHPHLIQAKQLLINWNILTMTECKWSYSFRNVTILSLSSARLEFPSKFIMNQVTAGACHIASFRCAGAKFLTECRKLENCLCMENMNCSATFNSKSRTLGNFSLFQKHCWQHLRTLRQ